MSVAYSIDNAEAISIKVTDSAAVKVYELIQEENNPKLRLRVFITGGGCSGFQYGFSFDEKANENEDDFEISKKFLISLSTIAANETANTNANHADAAYKDEQAEIKIVIDAHSFEYLKGAEIDYLKDIHGEKFIIRNNNNVKTTCGCGSSFSVD